MKKGNLPAPHQAGLPAQPSGPQSGRWQLPGQSRGAGTLLSRLPAGGARGQPGGNQCSRASLGEGPEASRTPALWASASRPPLPYSDSVGKPTLRLLGASLPSWSTEGSREGRWAGNPHLCTPVNSPGLDSLAPETTSPELPEGPWSPSHLWSLLGRPCSSLRQPNPPNQSAGRGPSSCHPQGHCALSNPWLLMPVGPTGSKRVSRRGRSGQGR